MKYQDLDVLVGAIPRAPILISHAVGGKMTYPLRIGESIIHAPDYLVSDLILGRRNRAILSVAPNGGTFRDSDTGTMPAISFGASLLVANASMVTATDVRLGVLTWTIEPVVPEPHGQLLAYVETENPPSMAYLGRPVSWRLRHTKPLLKQSTLAPFDSAQSSSFTTVLLGNNEGWDLFFAIYIITQGGMPDWFEARVTKTPGNPSPGFTIRRCHSDRPRVAWVPSA